MIPEPCVDECSPVRQSNHIQPKLEPFMERVGLIAPEPYTTEVVPVKPEPYTDVPGDVES